jgi:protein-tyrosine phosphatase
MAADADLVLTAERAHRDAVLTEVPTAFRRTFTLREFARLASYAGPGPAGDVVAQAAASRPAVGAVALEDDDVPDPYRRQTRHAVAVAEQVSESVHTCLDVLGLLPRGTGSAPRRTHGA